MGHLEYDLYDKMEWNYGMGARLWKAQFGIGGQVGTVHTAHLGTNTRTKVSLVTTWRSHTRSIISCSGHRHRRPTA